MVRGHVPPPWPGQSMCVAATRGQVMFGSRIEEPFPPLCRPSPTPEDIAAVTGVLRSGWLATGPGVADLKAASATGAGSRACSTGAAPNAPSTPAWAACILSRTRCPRSRQSARPQRTFTANRGVPGPPRCPAAPTLASFAPMNGLDASCRLNHEAARAAHGRGEHLRAEFAGGRTRAAVSDVPRCPWARRRRR